MQFSPSFQPGPKKLRLTARQLAAVDAKTTGATKREIGESLGVSKQAVKKRLQRARRRATAFLVSHNLSVPQTVDVGPPVRVRPLSLLQDANV